MSSHVVRLRRPDSTVSGVVVRTRGAIAERVAEALRISGQVDRLADGRMVVSLPEPVSHRVALDMVARHFRRAAAERGLVPSESERWTVLLAPLGASADEPAWWWRAL